MLGGFGFIRLSVRLIRAQVRWWPGNVTVKPTASLASLDRSDAPGGLHIHHAVFGIGFMIVAGLVALAVPDELLGWRAAAAAGFGVGTALVLDEFALILHLADVYWTEQGRTSIDALFVVVAVTGLLLIGVHPFVVEDLKLAADEPDTVAWALPPLLLVLGFAAVTVLKGKVWTGLLGMFLPVLLLVGAVRLARPGSPWARWRYRPDRRRGARKLVRSRRRESRLREPVVRAKVWLQDLIAGAPD
jgi:hypothetical protein